MDVDQRRLGDVVARLQRVQGQIDGGVRMIESAEALSPGPSRHGRPVHNRRSSRA